MPKIAKTKKKVSISKTKTVTKPKTSNKSKLASKPKVTVSNKSKEVSKGPIKISKNYVPKDNEKYMCEKHKVYFRMKLQDWKKELIKSNNEALYNGSMDDNSISADIVDQASSYTDKNVEMKAINRQIKLISEIDKALIRIKDDTYGYCLDTAEPIGLKRLMARPVAKYTIAAQEKHEKDEKVHADD
jgi:DnaK suppressor protein